jgi:hypothetical protein
MLARNLTRAAVAAAVAVVVLVAAAMPASATNWGWSSTTSSVTDWSTLGYNFVQDHTGDDIAFTNDTGGIAIDMRWQKCSDPTVVGSIKYNLAPNSTFRNIGTDFLATTCLKLKYRGYIQTGWFHGTTFWNYSWA